MSHALLNKVFVLSPSVVEEPVVLEGSGDIRPDVQDPPRFAHLCPSLWLSREGVR